MQWSAGWQQRDGARDSPLSYVNASRAHVASGRKTLLGTSARRSEVPRLPAAALQTILPSAD